MEKLILCTICRGAKVITGMGGMDNKCSKCLGVGMILVQHIDRNKTIDTSVRKRKLNRFKKTPKLPIDNVATLKVDHFNDVA